VASLVEDMLNAVQSEMGRYQRIITYWPCCEWCSAHCWHVVVQRQARGLISLDTVLSTASLHLTLFTSGNCDAACCPDCLIPALSATVPADGPDLERAVTGALREATLGVSRQCGLVQIKVRWQSWAWCSIALQAT